MAELAPELGRNRGARLGVEQLEAIAWLRWRILANGFRRRGGAAEFVGRLLLLPFLACLVIVPAAAAGFFAWYLAMHNSLARLDLLLWGAFALTQLLNINLGQPGTTFDPTELIRFPLTPRTYVLVRLCFGLLGPANIVVTLISAAIFVGITVDRPHLWPWTLLAMASFALANVLFSRMIFAWVDRWLSTRRAREVFTGLIFAASLGFQYLNVTYNPGFQSGHHRRVTPEHFHHAQAVMASLHPWISWLPPELSGAAVLAAQDARHGASFLLSLCVLVYAAIFLGVYAARMRTEYAGENLSDAANAVRPVRARTALTPTDAAPLAPPVPARGGSAWALPASLWPLLGKELLVLRRNTGLLYGVVAPTVMVFLFAGRLSMRGNSQWLPLLAVAYALLGLAPMSYNSFGLEGTGAQFYFISPVPLREVFFAKNVMHLLLAAFEVCTVMLVVAFVAGKPGALVAVFVLFWAVGTLLFNTSLGNLRSISAPKRVQSGKSPNRSQSQVSVWIAIGVLAVSTGFGIGFQFLARFLHRPSLAVGLVSVFTLCGLLTYLMGLRGIEAYAMARRETLLEELGKKI